jgi:4-amino-4-deoxy-L-arabinose transferase-like glycosyltransferase
MKNPPLSFEKRTLLLIGIATLIRLFLSGIVELNNDEVYYYTYAQHLQWNYFDHPPMVGLFIRFFTAGCNLNHEFFIRLPAVLAAAVCTWIIFNIGKLLQDAYTGWLAACLFTASFYASVITGLLILPDSAQLIFWLLSVYFILKIVKGNTNKRALNIWLLATGFFIGLCVLSKVHGVFLWIGFGAYILFKRRDLLKNLFLYISFLITAAMLTPSYLWTIHNQFSTYNYHSSRISFRQVQPDSFFRELTGSILYNNPVNIVLLISAIVYFKRKRTASDENGNEVLWWLGVPLIGTVLLLAVFNDTLPHWSGPAFTTMIPFAAQYMSNTNQTNRVQLSTMPIIIRWALGITGGVLVAAILIINYWPGSLGNKQLPAWGKNDVTLDMCGWRQFEHSFSKVYVKDQQQQRSNPPACIFTDYWFPAAHLQFYVGLPLHLPVIAVGSMGDIHHFAWLNQRLKPLQTNANAYYITVSNFYEPPPPELLTYFQSVSTPTLIPQMRSGRIVRYFYIYRLMQYHGGLPANGIIK